MRSFILLVVCCLLSSCWLFPKPTPVVASPELPPKPPQPVPCNVLPYAEPVPGREGFVFSPYHNKVVECKGLKRGTKVFDPYDTTQPRRVFLVP